MVYERREGTTARYREGDSCWPGQRVMRLPDLSEMEVLFHVNEVDARLVQLGMPVSIYMPRSRASVAYAAFAKEIQGLAAGGSSHVQVKAA